MSHGLSLVALLVVFVDAPPPLVAWSAAQRLFPLLGLKALARQT